LDHTLQKCARADGATSIQCSYIVSDQVTEDMQLRSGLLGTVSAFPSLVMINQESLSVTDHALCLTRIFHTGTLDTSGLA